MLVGLHGRGDAGNIDAARYLVRRHGFTRYSIADPLRDILLALDPTLAGGERLRNTVADNGWSRIKTDPMAGPEVKRMLDAAGAQVRTLFGQDILLDAMGRWMTSRFGTNTSSERIVVPDINLDREALWIKDHGGIIIAIDRPGTHLESGAATDDGIFPRYIDHTLPSSATIGPDVATALNLEPTQRQD